MHEVFMTVLCVALAARDTIYIVHFMSSLCTQQAGTLTPNLLLTAKEVH